MPRQHASQRQRGQDGACPCRRSRSRKRSAGRSHQSICYVIEIRCTATPLWAVSERWASGIGRPRPAHPGRTDIASGRSVQSDRTVWTTWLSWESAIFSICCAVMRPTTIGAEPTCPWTRMRQRGDQFTSSGASKRGPSSAACIITTFAF